jgi:hypothetical protein
VCISEDHKIKKKKQKNKINVFCSMIFSGNPSNRVDVCYVILVLRRNRTVFVGSFHLFYSIRLVGGEWAIPQLEFFLVLLLLLFFLYIDKLNTMWDRPTDGWVSVESSDFGIFFKTCLNGVAIGRNEPLKCKFFVS